MTRLEIHAYGTTNVGRVRELNEDTFFSGTTVFAVADGMGGHAAGEVASATAVTPLQAIDGQQFRDPQAATDALADAVSQANEMVLAKAAEDPDLKGMGTTLTTVMLRAGRLHLAHVGDSRAYLLRGGVLQMLTEDHTLVAQMVKEGRITEDQALIHPHRSVITRAIGVEYGIPVDTSTPLELLPGDQVLLCSDGLTGPVSDAMISQILLSEPDGDLACQRLIQAANDGGGPDNITCVLLRAQGDSPAGAPMPLMRGALGNDDVTAELGDPAALAAHAEAQAAAQGSPGAHHGAPERGGQSQDLNARKLAELADGAPDIDMTPPELRGLGRRRAGAAAAAIVVLVVVFTFFGYISLQRSYYVGVTGDGEVAIYNGVPFLSAVTFSVERQGIFADELPDDTRQMLEEGVSQESQAAAEGFVADTLIPETLEFQLQTNRDDETTDDPTRDPTEDATEDPTEQPTSSTAPPVGDQPDDVTPEECASDGPDLACPDSTGGG